MEKTSSEEIIEKRYRHFMILLYEDTTSYSFENVLQDIKGNFKNYAYIEHEKEKEETKNHYHLILSLDNPRTIESLANRLGIPKNHIQNIKGLRGACRYLIHKDNEDKIQYDIDKVVVSKSFKQTYYNSFDDLQSDTEIYQNIINFIKEEKKAKVEPMEIEINLGAFVIDGNFNRVYKRFYNTFIKLIYK